MLQIIGIAVAGLGLALIVFSLLYRRGIDNIEVNVKSVSAEDLYNDLDGIEKEPEEKRTLIRDNEATSEQDATVIEQENPVYDDPIPDPIPAPEEYTEPEDDWDPIPPSGRISESDEPTEIEAKETPVENELEEDEPTEVDMKPNEEESTELGEEPTEVSVIPEDEPAEVEQNASSVIADLKQLKAEVDDTSDVKIWKKKKKKRKRKPPVKIDDAPAPMEDDEPTTLSSLDDEATVLMAALEDDELTEAIQVEDDELTEAVSKFKR